MTATEAVPDTRPRPTVPRGAMAVALLAGALGLWLVWTSTGSLREELKWLQVLVARMLCVRGAHIERPGHPQSPASARTGVTRSGW